MGISSGIPRRSGKVDTRACPHFPGSQLRERLCAILLEGLFSGASGKRRQLLLKKQE
jgi:hypothetical protein